MIDKLDEIKESITHQVQKFTRPIDAISQKEYRPLTYKAEAHFKAGLFGSEGQFLILVLKMGR